MTQLEHFWWKDCGKQGVHVVVVLVVQISRGLLNLPCVRTGSDRTLIQISMENCFIIGHGFYLPVAAPITFIHCDIYPHLSQWQGCFYRANSRLIDGLEFCVPDRRHETAVGICICLRECSYANKIVPSNGHIAT